MTLDIGSRLGPYEVLGALGVGGMGEVYRARDPKLNRDVAIKVLPASVSGDTGAFARFEREAHSVAALSHPNILSIFDFGREGKVAYAVMELLEGGTLRDRLKEGPLSPRVAIDWALQIARGLAAAHDRGIVHRDMKPDNVFVTKDGHLKILDFGLAKRVEIADERHTQTGMVVGTVGYMSPEQVRGQPVDRRSDVFSFGAILYEMLTGRRAFRKGSAAETMEAIMRDDPREMSRAGGIPPALQRLLQRCLEKDPAKRFDSARELVAALEELWTPVTSGHAPRLRPRWPRRWAAVAIVAALAVAGSAWLWARRPRRVAAPAARARWTATSGRPARLVVLPFENLGAPEDAYFSAGITEEIIGRLANLKGLTVISRTTAIGYDRRGKTIRRIGDELDVDFVLEGTVKWEHAPGTAGRVRISPQLIQVADDAHVWGDRFDRTAADVFAIESEVGEAVARAAGLRLVPREEAALKATSTKDMEAFDLYLRGLAIASRSQTKRDQEEALSLFGAAAARDPSFTQALAMLARTHLFIHFLKLDASPEHVERAKDAVAKLEALGPDLAETHVARAYLDYWALFDLPNARDEFQAALTQQPSNADAVLGLAYVLRRQGLWEQAASQMSKLVELDPRNPTVLFQYGNTCMLLRRYDQAERLWKSSAVLYPQSGNAWGRRAWLQVLAKGDVRAARAVLADARTVGTLVDDSDWLALASFRVALAAKDYDAALELLGAPGRTAFSNNFVYLPATLLRGEVLTLTGHAQDARAAFETARRDLAERVAASPDDSRYQGALGLACAGLGLADEALKAARRGVELMPATKDSWVGCWRLEELALVEASLGKKDDALAHLGELLARTGELTPHVLRLDPRWEPLRADPRFAELLSRS